MSAEPRVRTRRQAGAEESLLSIVLVLEAVLVFFIVLVAFGLKVLSPAVAFGGGAALVVVLVLDSRLLRFRAAVWLGWVLQVGFVVLGILLPLMYFIGAVFLAIWIYCFITGRRLDQRNANTALNNESKENE